jgi:hypothetical protein
VTDVGIFHKHHGARAGDERDAVNAALLYGLRRYSGSGRIRSSRHVVDPYVLDLHRYAIIHDPFDVCRTHSGENTLYRCGKQGKIGIAGIIMEGGTIPSDGKDCAEWVLQFFKDGIRNGLLMGRNANNGDRWLPEEFSDVCC